MVLLKAIRKGVDMTVVDQRVVAISPRKLLGPENRNILIHLEIVICEQFGGVKFIFLNNP